MSAAIDAVRAILIEELSEVTPAMLDAGVSAQLEVTTFIDGRGRRQLKTGLAEVASDIEFTAIWQAMLAAALGEPR